LSRNSTVLSSGRKGVRRKKASWGGCQQGRVKKRGRPCPEDPFSLIKLKEGNRRENDRENPTKWGPLATSYKGPTQWCLRERGRLDENGLVKHDGRSAKHPLLIMQSSETTLGNQGRDLRGNGIEQQTKREENLWPRWKKLTSANFAIPKKTNNPLLAVGNRGRSYTFSKMGARGSVLTRSNSKTLLGRNNRDGRPDGRSPIKKAQQ